MVLLLSGRRIWLIGRSEGRELELATATAATRLAIRSRRGSVISRERHYVTLEEGRHREGFAAAVSLRPHGLRFRLEGAMQVGSVYRCSP